MQHGRGLTPLRILLSPATRQSLAPTIATVLASTPHQLLTVADCPVTETDTTIDSAIDAAFISRDVTGLATKTVRTEGSEAFYNVLRRSSRLRWVHIHSAGADRPIYQELRALGAQITTSSGANAQVVAQTAMAGLLALARRLPQLMQAQQARRWAPVTLNPPRDLAGQTVVLVGWGPIGQRIADFLHLLGMELIVLRHSTIPPTPATTNGVRMVNFKDFASVLPQADWLLLACPLTDQTHRLVDANALALMPRGAGLINVARGEVVVEADVIAALRSGQLGGAYLDVFEQEPLSAQSPLWALDNVIVTPHTAGHSDGNAQRVAEMFLANLQRWATAQTLAP